MDSCTGILCNLLAVKNIRFYMYNNGICRLYSLSIYTHLRLLALYIVCFWSHHWWRHNNRNRNHVQQRESTNEQHQSTLQRTRVPKQPNMKNNDTRKKATTTTIRWIYKIHEHIPNVAHYWSYCKRVIFVRYFAICATIVDSSCCWCD